MPERKYLYTERAHYMCPNMHFGILVEIEARFDASGIIASIGDIKSAHPLMRSLIAEEQGSSKIFYEEHSELEIPITIKEADDDWQSDYDAVSSAGWNVQKEALLKVFAYPSESGTRVLYSIRIRGGQYQHACYRLELQRHGITQSMSRKGNCYDNCIMETFFGRLKNEMYYGHEKEYASFEEFSKAIEEYIDYYNNKRIQAKTKWMPPVQYRIASMCSA